MKLFILLCALLTACGAQATDWDSGAPEAGPGCGSGPDAHVVAHEDLIWCFALDADQVCYSGVGSQAACNADPDLPMGSHCSAL